MRVFVSFLLLGFMSGQASVRADVTLAPLFADHAVLQRGKPIPIWGRSEAGEKITVTFLDRQIRTTAGADGRWLVLLDPLEARTEGSDLVVSGKNTIARHDIVVGEVWLCGGPGGMKLPLVSVRNAGDVIAQTHLPLVRHIRIEETASSMPSDTVRTDGWQEAISPGVGEFSSAGFFFAREISQKLGVPVGLIDVTTNAAPLDAWLSPAALANDPAAAAANTRSSGLPGESTTTPASSAGGTPTALFNGMINPLLPYALRGALWHEAAGSAVYSGKYRSLFPGMIAAWRSHFGQGDFPFFWMQVAGRRLAADPRHPGLPAMREAQTQALALPNTGQAIAIDLAEEEDGSSLENAQAAGHRLALLAKNRVYGIVSDDAGPALASASREGAAMRVRLSHATSGLVAHDKPVQSLELAGVDKVFRPATAKIERETLLVTSPEVKWPAAVRYAWRNAPEANLYNGAGLPAAPFRSDDW